MSLIILGNLNKYIIFAILGGIAKCIAGTLLYIYKNELKKYPFMLGLNAGLGMSLSIIPGIILKIKNKGIHEKEAALNEKLFYNNKEYYSTYNPKKIKTKKALIILLSAFLDFLQKFLVFLFSDSITNNVWIFNIVFLNIFSLCILKTKLYRHQLISSSLMIVLGIILNISILKDMPVKKVPALLLSIFIEITYSLCIVVNKYGLDHCFCTPIEISFYEGFFELIINLIFLSLATNIKVDEENKIIKHLKFVCENITNIDNITNIANIDNIANRTNGTDDTNRTCYLDNWYFYYDVFKGKEIVMFIITLLSRWIFNLFSLIVIKYYTASHVIFLLIIGEVENAFIDISDPWLQYMAVIVYIALLILLIIFTEIFVLNFWGCEKDTKNIISQRALNKEIEDSLTGDDTSGRDSNLDIEIDDGIEIHMTKF